MREAVLEIGEQLHKGLRREESETLNRIVLEKCEGLMVGQYGLAKPFYKPFPLDANSLANNGVQVQYPFPQYFHLRNVDLIIDVAHFFKVDSSFNLSQISVQDVTAGKRWRVADLGKGWVAVNGTCIVVDFTGNDSLTVFDRDVSSVVEFGGRIILGGFTKFFSNIWFEYFDSLSGGGMEDLDDFVYWSAVGFDDLFMFFEKTLPDSEFIRYVMERGDFGFAPTKGSVVNMEVLEDGVLVGTTKELSWMTPLVDPAPSFSINTLMRVGVKGLGGSDKAKLVVVNDGSVYYVTRGKIERLGFKEFFKNANEVEICYDYGTDTFFLTTDSQETYAFYNGTLTRLHEVVTSCANGYVLSIKSVLK